MARPDSTRGGAAPGSTPGTAAFDTYWGNLIPPDSHWGGHAPDPAGSIRG